MTKRTDETDAEKIEEPGVEIETPESTPPSVLDPAPSMTRAQLLAAMDAHEAEGDRLEAAMAELGLTSKDVRAIRKAEKAAASAREALAKLMGEGA